MTDPGERQDTAREGLTVAAAAARLGLTPDAVRAHIHDLRGQFALLRDQLEATDDPLRASQFIIAHITDRPAALSAGEDAPGRAPGRPDEANALGSSTASTSWWRFWER